MDYIKVSILFADLPIIVFLSRFVYNRKNIITLKSLVIVSVTTIFLGTVNELQAVFRGTALYGINRYFISEKEIVKHYGIIVNEIVSLFKSGTEKKAVASIKYGLPKEFRKNSLYSPNIVVIQVESLGAGIENSVCENLKIAPFLFSLASESIYCQRIRSFHTSGGTTDCEMSVLNSIMPSVVYPTCKLTSYTFPNSIVKILNKSGYKTNAFHGNNGNFFNRGLTMSKMGFQEFFDIDRMQLQQQGWGASDSAVFSFVSTLLDKEKKLFFYYIITMSSHGPFTNVLNYTHEKYLSEKDEYIRHYYNSINYVDSELGRFILNIKNKFPDTYFVIIGDHSVNVPSPYLEDSHGVAENQAVEYVPFFMITPDRAVKKLEGQHSFLDIAPTILDIANVQCYFRTDGQSLIK